MDDIRNKVLSILTQAAEIFNTRDEKYGEFVMKLAVELYSTIGKYKDTREMKEKDGYLFMVCLKLARLVADDSEDSLVDIINYLILMQKESIKEPIS